MRTEPCKDQLTTTSSKQHHDEGVLDSGCPPCSSVSRNTVSEPEMYSVLGAQMVFA
uniref:Uncharacterized protein n=1 Tax=Anguilla anguilla TaxID=7936 RepID=A0A0E9XJR9_ANGAN